MSYDYEKYREYLREYYEDDIPPPEPGYAEKRAERRYDWLQQYLLKDPSKFKETRPGSIISNVKWSLVDVVGPPNSGKTTLSSTFAAGIELFYSKKGLKTWTVLAPDLATAITETPFDSEVVVYIIDDAPVSHFAAGRRQEDVYTVGVFFIIRHLVPLLAPRIKYIALIFNTQRFKSLDKVFRSAPIIIHKALLGDKEERMEMKKELGSTLYRALMDITRGIYLFDDEYYYQFFVYQTLWGRKGIVRISEVAFPENVIVSKRRRLSLKKFIGPSLKDMKAAAEIFIAAMAVEGRSWHDVEFVLSFLRENVGLKISQNYAKRVFDKFSLIHKRVEGVEIA